MPYIVTTKRRNECGQNPASCKWGDACADCRDGLSRRAVATLDEAHDVAEMRFPDSIPADVLAEWFPESGGTVGPLPDGTVIEVEATTWTQLEPPGVLSWPPSNPATQQHILNAFNAREAKR